MIVVTAALKGGVGKTTTSVYLAAVAAAARYDVTLIDADPQASAAEWIETAIENEDDYLSEVSLVEAPTDRLLSRALEKVSKDEVVFIDPAPGEERMLERALSKASVAIIPTRVGGVETARAEAVLEMVPRRVPAGLVITSARTYTRDYMEAMDAWREAGVTVWGTIPERVAIAHGPAGALSDDGIEAYKAVWRRALRASR